MKITGAVLDQIGHGRRYADTRPLSVETLELDAPGPGEVLVEIECAGVCHSDLSVIDGTRRRPVPMLLGHEGAGRVAALGPGVHDLAVGDRVVLTFLPRCGDCVGCASGGMRPCVPGSSANSAGTMLSGGRRLRRDQSEVSHHLGVSAFATHAVLDSRSVVRVQDDVPAEVAALMGCAVLTGGGAVMNVARPEPGDTVAVVGMGGVGLSALLVALATDGVRAVAIDPSPEKQRVARSLGAHLALDPETALAQNLKARAAIESAGTVAALETAIALTDAGGTTVAAGLPSPEARITLAPTAMVAEGRTLVGSYLGSSVAARDIPRFVDLWRAGRLPVEKLISTRLPLHQINRAMDDLSDGSVMRQIVTMSAGATRRRGR